MNTMFQTDVHKQDIRVLHNRIKQSAKRRGIPFDLTLTDLNNLSFPVTCPILNIPLTFNRRGVQDNSYSIDRIDSSLGYTVDNIVVISYRANVLKSNASIAEMEALVNFFKELNSQSQL